MNKLGLGIRRRNRKNGGSALTLNANTFTATATATATGAQTAEVTEMNLEEAYKRHQFQRNKRKSQAEEQESIPENIMLFQTNNSGRELDTDTDNDTWGNGNGNDNDKRTTTSNIDAKGVSAGIVTDADGCRVLETDGGGLDHHHRTRSQNNSSLEPRQAMSTEAVKKDESKFKKISIRLFFGFLMVFIFLSLSYMGHIYLCGLIFFTEVMLFRELVKVRYNTFFHIIEETIPLFRTTQWLWFWTSIFYTYSDFVVEVIKGNTSLHYLLSYAQFHTGFAFLLYSGTFVLTISTIQPGYIRFQLNQLCWTILVLCLTVGQLKYIMHNVFNGLFWFTLPIMLVVSNDSFAWLAGITCGRKFIRREFISISPNKTWEGFIGGWIGTMISGWHLAKFMAKYTWMICPETTFSLLPGPLECEANPVFLPATNIFPSQIFELVPHGLAQMIPGVVDMCMVGGNSTYLTACISGKELHSHHHFELVIKNLYPVQIHALGLSLFASFVAPFGGFLASAIKRAYGLKDFASFIPGHGGMMDRMDCQLLMSLCTWVHYNTFVKMTTVSVPKMIYMYKLMQDGEQEEFLRRVSEL